jgi:UDP-N-acetylmuramyl tripeptide synthase
VVVIAGKGHEDYQIIGPKTFPFDDRMIALESIHRRLGMAPQSSGNA